MRRELVTDALRVVAEALSGDGLRGAVFHSGSGSGVRYASKEFAQACSGLGVTRSRGAVGTSRGNAAADSLNATTKRETLQERKRGNGARRPGFEVFRWATR